MKGIYTGYKCLSCKKEIILLTEDVNKQMNENRYLSCAFCNSRHLQKENETDSLKECMNSSFYKRCHGALRQVK